MSAVSQYRIAFLLAILGNYCTMCFKCYEDNDYESQMMQCSICNHWVHAKCEGLTGEYDIISCFLGPTLILTVLFLNLVQMFSCLSSV